MWKFTYHETINASPQRVFDLISDFPASVSWNPFVVAASGPAKLGGVIRGWVKMGWFKIPFRHKIYEYTPNKSVCWK